MGPSYANVVFLLRTSDAGVIAICRIGARGNAMAVESVPSYLIELAEIRNPFERHIKILQLRNNTKEGSPQLKERQSFAIIVG